MAAKAVYVSYEFDIFADRPLQTSTLNTVEIPYKPIASVDQSDLEFMIPENNDTYIELNMQLYVKGQLIMVDGTELEENDHTAAVNNFLHSLFSQCNISLNVVSITPSSDNYNYSASLETLLVYGDDSAFSRPTNAYWYKDEGNMQVCDPTDTYTDTTIKGFIRLWNLHNNAIEMVGRLHSDICNVAIHLLPGVRVQVKMTKGRSEFYFMNKDADSKVIFKFLDAQLLVKRVKPNPSYLVAHRKVLQAGAVAKYTLSRVEVKTFTYGSGSQSLSIDNVVLETLLKRMLFTMVKNKDILGFLDMKPFTFRH
jgi:hypothetical protein